MLAYAAFERNGLPESSTSPGIPQLFVNCRNQAITLIEKWMPIKEITKALRVRLTGEEEKRLAKQGGAIVAATWTPLPSDRLAARIYAPDVRSDGAAQALRVTCPVLIHVLDNRCRWAARACGIWKFLEQTSTEDLQETLFVTLGLPHCI
jgi:hypothetical protein